MMKDKKLLFKERSSSTYPKVAGEPSGVVPVEAGEESHGGNFSSFKKKKRSSKYNKSCLKML